MCETPAAAAICSTVVVSYPCSRNSRSALARMRSRVAVFLRCLQSGSGSVTGLSSRTGGGVRGRGWLRQARVAGAGASGQVTQAGKGCERRDCGADEHDDAHAVQERGAGGSQDGAAAWKVASELGGLGDGGACGGGVTGGQPGQARAEG